MCWESVSILLSEDISKGNHVVCLSFCDEHIYKPFQNVVIGTSLLLFVYILLLAKFDLK